MRAVRGVDYLEKWSNLPVLEGLLTAYVTEARPTFALLPYAR